MQKTYWQYRVSASESSGSNNQVLIRSWNTMRDVIKNKEVFYVWVHFPNVSEQVCIRFFIWWEKQFCFVNVWLESFVISVFLSSSSFFISNENWDILLQEIQEIEKRSKYTNLWKNNYLITFEFIWINIKTTSLKFGGILIDQSWNDAEEICGDLKVDFYLSTFEFDKWLAEFE